jgi:hypothetical protein
MNWACRSSSNTCRSFLNSDIGNNLASGESNSWSANGVECCRCATRPVLRTRPRHPITGLAGRKFHARISCTTLPCTSVRRW